MACLSESLASTCVRPIQVFDVCSPILYCVTVSLKYFAPLDSGWIIVVRHRFIVHDPNGLAQHEQACKDDPNYRHSEQQILEAENFHLPDWGGSPVGTALNSDSIHSRSVSVRVAVLLESYRSFSHSSPVKDICRSFVPSENTSMGAFTKIVRKRIPVSFPFAAGVYLRKTLNRGTVRQFLFGFVVA